MFFVARSLQPTERHRDSFTVTILVNPLSKLEAVSCELKKCTASHVTHHSI
jgi:hypothetical protein